MNLLQNISLSNVLHIAETSRLYSLKLPEYRAWMNHKVSQWKTILWEFVFSRGMKLLNTTGGFLFINLQLVHLAALLN